MSNLTKKSEMWQQLSRNKIITNDFLNPENVTTHGIGMGRMSAKQYEQRFKDWVARYKDSVSPEELANYSEPVVGAPRVLEHLGYKASVPYLKNFALAKHIAKLIDKSNARILEIGAGYGGMAYILMQMLSVKSYTVIDLPEVLPLSKFYLTECHPGCELEFRTPDNIGNGEYDFVINTASFGEMPKETAQEYVSWAMQHSSALISHNSVRRTPSGVRKHSEYGFQKYFIDSIVAQPDVGGAFNAQHMLLRVRPGAPNITADKLDLMQAYVSLGMHEDLNGGNDAAIEQMVAAASRWFLRNKYLNEYMKLGRSMLARAYASRLLDQPINAPDYIGRELLAASKFKLVRHLNNVVR